MSEAGFAPCSQNLITYHLATNIVWPFSCSSSTYSERVILSLFKQRSYVLKLHGLINDLPISFATEHIVSLFPAQNGGPRRNRASSSGKTLIGQIRPSLFAREFGSTRGQFSQSTFFAGGSETKRQAAKLRNQPAANRAASRPEAMNPHAAIQPHFKRAAQKKNPPAGAAH